MHPMVVFPLKTFLLLAYSAYIVSSVLDIAVFSLFKIPANLLPLSWSITSPNALTATIAPTIKSSI